MDPELASATLDLKYISTQESSIIKNALGQILMIFAKTVNHENIPNVPFAKFYFYQGFESNIEQSLTSALLLQIRSVALSLVEHTVGSKSQLTGTNKHPDNVPTPLIEQIAVIIKDIFVGKKELSDSEFIPFDTRTLVHHWINLLI